MRIFIDTEFTDLVDIHLISIALVAEDGRQFYGERNDFDLSKCNDFVRKTVLPLLGKRPAILMTKQQMREALLTWLQQFQNEIPVICFDFIGDWRLLSDLLAEDMPVWLKSSNVRGHIDESLRLQYFKDTGLQEHHALYDAHANRFAYRAST